MVNMSILNSPKSDVEERRLRVTASRALLTPFPMGRNAETTDPCESRPVDCRTFQPSSDDPVATTKLPCTVPVLALSGQMRITPRTPLNPQPRRAAHQITAHLSTDQLAHSPVTTARMVHLELPTLNFQVQRPM